MTEEEKDDLNEQQTFLNDHEELLKTINKKQETTDEQTEQPPEEVPVPETDTEETPVAGETPEPVEPEPIGKPIAEEKTPQQRQHSPQHEEVLKRQALEQKEVKEVLVFFQKYAKPATIVIVVVCLLVLADKFLKAQRHKKEVTADTALLDARGAEDLQDIVNDYASTPSGPMALMELARIKFNAGQFDEAEELYTRFTAKHADHELAVQAELNLITCKEVKGQLGEAHMLYGQFAKKHEGAYLVPAAMMGQARCLEALDQLDEAQIAYEDIIVNFPETAWSRIAEANLKTVLGKKQ